MGQTALIKPLRAFLVKLREESPQGLEGRSGWPKAHRVQIGNAANPASSAVRITVASACDRINGGEMMMFGPDTRSMAPA